MPTDPTIDDLLPPLAEFSIATALLGHRPSTAAMRIDPPQVRPNGTIAEATIEVEDQVYPLVIKSLPRGLSEANAYRCLLAEGAPVAAMHACFHHRGQEVLILERLPRIGHSNDPTEFARVIAALAQFNAQSPSALPQSPPGWLAGCLAHWRVACERARSGAWGPLLADLSAPLAGAWDDLLRFARTIEEDLAGFPLAATHHDPCLGNCGWRSDGSVRFIDLGYANRHPLFADLAIKLGASADPWPDPPGRQHWIAHYCDHYARAGGAAIELKRAELAMALQFAAQAMWLDRRTAVLGDAELTATRPDHSAHGWSWWYARTWRRLSAMCVEGMTGASVP